MKLSSLLSLAALSLSPFLAVPQAQAQSFEGQTTAPDSLLRKERQTGSGTWFSGGTLPGVEGDQFVTLSKVAYGPGYIYARSGTSGRKTFDRKLESGGSASLQWADSLVLALPGYEGETVELVAKVQLTGGMDSSVPAEYPTYLNTTYAGYTFSFKAYKNYSTQILNQAQSGTHSPATQGTQPANVITLRIPVEIGAALDLRCAITANGYAGGGLAAPTGEYSAYAEIGVLWLGVEAVNYGGSPIGGWTLLNSQGVNYASAFSDRISPFRALAVTNGWRNTWLGWLQDEKYPWVYSLEHGWLYFLSDDPATLFIYGLKDDLGWLYVSEATYPTLYSFQYGKWLFYYRGTGPGGVRWFYDTTSTPGAPQYIRLPAP